MTDDRRPSTPAQRRWASAVVVIVAGALAVGGGLLSVRGVSEVLDARSFRSAGACGPGQAGGCIAALPATVTPLGFDATTPAFGGVTQRVHVTTSSISRDVDLRSGASVDQVNASRATAEVWHGKVTALTIAGRRTTTTQMPRYARGIPSTVIGALLGAVGLLILAGMVLLMVRGPRLTSKDKPTSPPSTA